MMIFLFVWIVLFVFTFAVGCLMGGLLVGGLLGGLVVFAGLFVVAIIGIAKGAVWIYGETNQQKIYPQKIPQSLQGNVKAPVKTPVASAPSEKLPGTLTFSLNGEDTQLTNPCVEDLSQALDVILHSGGVVQFTKRDKSQMAVIIAKSLSARIEFKESKASETFFMENGPRDHAKRLLIKFARGKDTWNGYFWKPANS